MPRPRNRLLIRRLAAQLLTGTPATSVEAVVHRLLAVQAQDPRGARLAVRVRSSGLTSADVDTALNSGALVTSWLNRGTLHLVHRDDFWWLHALTTPQLLVSNARRLTQEGVPPAAAERGVRAITRALEHGPRTRLQLREAAAAAGVRTDGQAIVHVLALASLRGHIVRGPMRGRQHAYVLAHDWLGEPKRQQRDNALGELALRYLAGHGPASARDLAKWAGITVGTARSALNAAAPAVRPSEGDLVELRSASPAGGLPPPRLFGSFEPVLMGWTSRDFVLGVHEGAIVTGGMFRPWAFAGGTAVGSWILRGKRVELQQLSGWSATTTAALGREADAVVRFLGLSG